MTRAAAGTTSTARRCVGCWHQREREHPMSDRMNGTRVLTALSIGRSAARLVEEVCICGGNQSRTVWRQSGDLRNQHRETCPAVIVLSRLPGIMEEVR